MYSSNAQPTGTNRPRACPNTVQNQSPQPVSHGQEHPRQDPALQSTAPPPQVPASTCSSQPTHPDGATVARTHNSIRNTKAWNTPTTPPPRARVWVRVFRQSYGGHSERETPGPIPNPEVKPFSADGTATERLWESRTPPDKQLGRGHLVTGGLCCI